MNMKKKNIMIKLLNIFLFVSTASCAGSDFSYLNNTAKNVILFIGDGMGENHIKNSEVYLDKKMFFTSFEKQGYVSTDSKTPFVPTDSAAAATAMATGKKVENGNISFYNNKYIKTISELLKENNYGVGIVTTDSLDGATPSAFSSHSNNRNESDNIIKGQLQSNIDLFLGAGYSTYSSYQEQFKNKGYLLVNTFSQLNFTNEKVFGCFEKINKFNNDNDLPRLSDLVNYATHYMENKYPNGYFLMIEGAHIDKRSHDNDIISMIEYLDEFDNAIKTAVDLVNKEDTCFIVTADHETGGLSFSDNRELISNDLYSTTSHTDVDVKYYIELDNDEINKLPFNIDNTDIYNICKSIFNIR